MGRAIARRPLLRLLGAIVATVVATALVTACNGRSPDRVAPSQLDGSGPGTAQLNPSGPFYVGDQVPLTGYTEGIEGVEHTLALQSYSAEHRRWSTVGRASVRNGGFAFTAPGPTAGPVKYRTVVRAASGKEIAVSNVVTVQLVAPPVVPPACAQAPSRTTCPQPEPLAEQQTVDVPACPRLTVTILTQTRTVGWRWDDASTSWVQDPTPWEAVSGGGQQRDAGVADCVRVVDQVPRRAALPDLRIKDLTRCGKGDAEATGGSCFMIVPSAPHDEDFPSLEGRKLLKFPVITLNVGAGPVEILADRSGDDVKAWEAFESFHDAHGNLLGSIVDPAVEFYFAGDGHEHWHVRDFDGYELLDAGGTEVARAEKHGYCMQDNTSYDPVQGQPGVPAEPVYPDDTTCGKGLPKALTIIHGLSRGWGDTYPTSLPDQAIDITGVPDGVYTVRVHADVRKAVTESNEGNNVATVKVRITGNQVSVVPNSSTGGIP